MNECTPSEGIPVVERLLGKQGPVTNSKSHKSRRQQMVTGAKKLNFPKPGATKEKEDITMIDAERMLVHYNQDHPNLKAAAQRVTQKIMDHTSRLAVAAGWKGAAVAKDAITGHTSGMMLLRAKKTTITPDVVDAEVVAPKLLKG
jgi:hypothetical protein